MSIIYYEEDIYDRVIETKDINLFLSTESSQNRMLWVCGDAGLVKTSIIKKALQTIDQSKQIIIKVETPSLNQNDCIIQGQYLNYITSNGHKEMAKYNWSMQNFFTYVDNARVNKQEIQNVIDTEITKISHTIISTIVSRYLHTGINDISKILLSTDSESILIKREYLKSVFYKGNIILYISNFQNIDIVSSTELDYIISNTSKNSFIFEYTTTNNDTSPVMHYQELWSNYCISAIQNIDFLPLEFAVMIGGNKFKQQINEWQNFYNEVIKGNLFKVKALKFQQNSGFSDADV